MTISQIKEELEAARTAVARLERSLIDSLAALPSRYGFATVADFVDALKGATDGRRSGGAKKGPKAAKPRLRAKITDRTRSAVKKLVAAGKTGLEISQALKISTASVQNIRRALGLTRGSAKKAPAKPKAVRKKRAPKKAKPAPQTAAAQAPASA